MEPGSLCSSEKRDPCKMMVLAAPARLSDGFVRWTPLCCRYRHASIHLSGNKAFLIVFPGSFKGQIDNRRRKKPEAPQ